MGVRSVAGFTRRRDAFALVLLATAALAFNLAIIRVFPPAHDRGQTPFLWPLISNVAHGKGYVACNNTYFLNCDSTTQVTAMYEPLPILLFAGVARLSNDSLYVEAVVQALIATATVVGTFLIGRQVAGRGTALLAAAMWVVYLPAARLVPQVAADLPAALLATWGMVAFLYARRSDRKLAWLAAGACLGLGTLSRSAVLVLAPVLVAGLLLWTPARARCGLTWRVQRGLLVLLACAAVQVPWVVRNQLALGRPIVGSTLVGYNLVREASALTTPKFIRYVTVNEGVDALHGVQARRPDLTGQESEAQLDLVYRQEALSTIAAHPLRYVTLSVARFPMLWFNWPRDPNADGPEQRTSGPMEYMPNLEQAFVLATGVLAFLVMPWRRSWPLVVSVVGLSLEHMLVHAQQRYLVPVMPLVVVLAAVGCVYVAQRLRVPRLSLTRDAPLVALLAGAKRVARETCALYLAVRDPRVRWYVKLAGVVGVLVCLVLMPGAHSGPALDRIRDVAALLLGLAVAHRLFASAGLSTYRAQAQLLLSASSSRLILGWVLAAWVVLAALTAGVVILDPI